MKKLLQRLRDTGYQQFYLFFGDTNMRYKDWMVAGSEVAGPLQVLVSLFLLQAPVAVARCAEAFGDEAIEQLQQAEILRLEKNQAQSNAYYLLVHRGLFYFCQMGRDPAAYIGEDSVALSHYQTPLRGARVLDLCAGAGIQSLVAAARGNRVTAVERNPAACRVHAINLALNELADRVEIVPAAFEAFAGRTRDTFDQILFNPPLAPVPRDADFPVVGHGGLVGLASVEAILKGFQARLSAGGRFEFVGMTVVPAGARPAKLPVEILATRRKLSGRVHLLSRHSLRERSMVFEAHATTLAMANGLSLEDARQLLLRQYRAFESFALYFSSLGATPSGSKPSVSRIDMSATHYGGWFS